MPARAPASIDMLQTVMRSSTDSASNASPRYSITHPVAPSVPMRPMMPNQVLGGNSRADLAIDSHFEGLRLRLPQALGCKHVLDFAGADSEGERAERTVG